ncbi:MAG: hypothetical protein AVDCRST_MAG02-4423 [uncultured Rubrobacteraceae bacterium]|uniref:Uncharacterized protein n=1 Tax=uncultured Rubrobacteraceae bacterium TaxID=349277 RepID=A0A6J4RSE7_9ACTN|nr:MAG: hypothetical protein AVDCRST_MAG02-4423 [uncultured Rubrobacteraceae bacterium]
MKGFEVRGFEVRGFEGCVYGARRRAWLLVGTLHLKALSLKALEPQNLEPTLRRSA